jgi:hypothetical protein
MGACWPIEGRHFFCISFLYSLQAEPNQMTRRSFKTLAGGALATPAGCGAQAATSFNREQLILPHDSEIRSGGSRMIEIEGGYHVWTKKVGDSPIKVLVPRYFVWGPEPVVRHRPPTMADGTKARKEV